MDQMIRGMDSMVRTLILVMLFSLFSVYGGTQPVRAAEEIYIKYNSLDQIVETTATGTTKTVSLSGVGSGLQIGTQQAGEYAALAFTVPARGIYTVIFETFNHTRGADSGAAAIDSPEHVLSDDISYYSLSAERTTFDVALGTMELSAGEHRLYLILPEAEGNYHNLYASAIKLLPKGIELSISNDQLEIGSTAQLSWAMTDGSTLDPSTTAVTYSSDAPEVADVSSSGEVTAYASGIAQLSVSVSLDGLTYYSSLPVVVGDDTTLYEEDFNMLATGTVPPELETNYAEVVEVPGETDKSLSLNTTTDETTSKTSYTFPAPVTEQITVSFDVYAAAPDEGYYYIYPGHFYDENGKRPVRFYMDSNRHFWGQDGSTQAIIGGYESNRWYNIKFIIDVASQKWDVYIDNKLVGLGYSFRNQAASLTRMEFTSFNSSEAYVDNLKVAIGGQVIPEHHGAVYGQQITGEPIGGAEGYSDVLTVDDATHIVTGLSDLQEAMSNAESGDIVFIPGDRVIDLTPLAGASILIPQGVTLASDRGQAGSEGALIFTDYLRGVAADSQYDNNEVEIPGLLVAGGPDVRITGLRLQGQDGERHEDEVKASGANTYWVPLSVGIESGYDIEVDNNEIHSFTYAGVKINGGEAYIHHNNIHHTMLQGLGYGITMGAGAENRALNVLAEANIFDQFRHAIAASGVPSEQYEARYNLVKDGYSHAFDMHNYKEGDTAWADNGGVFIAGKRVDIHHNTFMDTNIGNGDHKIITIRGVPLYGAHISNNWFLIPEELGYHAVRQYNSYGSHFVGANAYGEGEDKVVREGWLPPGEPNFVLSNVQFRDLNGNEVTSLSPSSFIQVSADITNMSWRPDTATMIVMLKDQGGAIVNMAAITEEIKGRTTFGAGVVGGTLSGGIMLPAHVEGHSLEVLLWDSLEGMLPASDVITFQ